MLSLALMIHNVFHVDQLSLYMGNEANGLTPPPLEPVTINGEEEYEVNHIRDSKLFGHTSSTLSDGKVMERVKTHGNPCTICSILLKKSRSFMHSILMHQDK